MNDVDYDLPATLFARQDGDLPGSESYEPTEFATLAEAVKHALEALDGDADFYISGATKRLDREQVRSAYDSPDFPLERSRPV